MSTTSTANSNAASPEAFRVLPGRFLNAYEIVNAADLSWPVNLYAVELRDELPQGNSARGRIKNVIWELRKKNKQLCRGYGFVVDVSPRLVAVPQAWNLPFTASSECTVR